MSFITKIIQKDQELLIYLNALGTEYWDSYWLIATNKLPWLPIYLVVLFLLFRYYKWKKTLAILLLVALLVAFSDQLVNLIKIGFHRLRPNNDPAIQNIIRVVKNVGGYSFVSGHATTSFAVTTLIIATLRNHFKPVYFILVWPILFTYSRIYLGVHYPVDVTLGMLLGLLIGFTFYRFSLVVLPKIK